MIVEEDAAQERAWLRQDPQLEHWRLERDQVPTPKEGEEPGGPES
jgi:hypothetical protein